MAPIRAVIDTNVLFEGLTQRGGVSGAIVDAWIVGLFQPCVSHTLAYEYVEVLSRKLIPSRWQRIRLVLDALLDRAEVITMHYSWRPSSPDPGDEHVIDCAMNARALITTLNTRDFEKACIELGVVVLRPVEFLRLLDETLT